MLHWTPSWPILSLSSLCSPDQLVKIMAQLINNMTIMTLNTFIFTVSTIGLQQDTERGERGETVNWFETEEYILGFSCCKW